ncbi:hypothetical protein Y1Q_0003312 [Alligator mississippiensis]|uniref:Uncharacterized protein n=1 Tax=Alligator mississippiensis TaxID=8496 RepID=A0A151MEB9_ALLMI|nr:hypothetical protein Y1Q_0003312 [Alligator mississippiensis]
MQLGDMWSTAQQVQCAEQTSELSADLVFYSCNNKWHTAESAQGELPVIAAHRRYPPRLHVNVSHLLQVGQTERNHQSCFAKETQVQYPQPPERGTHFRASMLPPSKYFPQ